MKRERVPNSSTSYYKSKRCKLGSTAVEMSLGDGETLQSEDDVGTAHLTDELHHVSVEAAQSSTSENTDENPDGAQGVFKVYKKPTQSYVMMIATAIMQAPTLRMSLGSIYDWIEKKYPYFTNNDGTHGRWRNSVRHNLSLNDCFIKVGRCEDGKGNYWSVHPQNLPEFKKGDFKQKQRRRRGRKKDTDTYLSLLSAGAGDGQVIIDSNTGVPYTPYTDEERKAYRLDDALMKRKLRGIHYLQSEPYPSSTSTHSWHYGSQYPVSQLQYSHYHNSQDNVQCCYTHTPTQCNTMYNITPTTAHNYYYYHPPPHATGHLSTPCQCCQTPPPIQYYRY